MPAYALLIYRKSDVAIPAAEDQRALAAHRALQAESKARDHLHAVARLDDTSTARSVVRGSQAEGQAGHASHDVSDGPFIETKEWLVGFYVLECDDQAHALARARALCADDYHAIEVRPVTWRAPA